jgi:hypothetical protein
MIMPGDPLSRSLTMPRDYLARAIGSAPLHGALKVFRLLVPP